MNSLKTIGINTMKDKLPLIDRFRHPASSRLLISILLFIITIAVYAPVRHYDFINFDDGGYVTENKHVQQGFTIDSIKWAFTLIKHNEKAYWHPVTWLSHMADCQFFGLNPGMHHLSSLFYHILNAILLFLVFSRMTGSLWKSAFIAALFTLHPIDLDSVAWISERKSLVSTSFWMFTMLAYAHYASRPSMKRYLLILIAFSLGLMAKPMLVTLPCVLLLLDFWPLYRFKWAQHYENSDTTTRPASAPVFQKATTSRLVLEKIPMLVLSFTAIWLSYVSLQKNSQILDTSIYHPISLRLSNALVSYIVYLWKMIRPIDLAIFYPFPAQIPIWQPIAAAIALIIVTALIIMNAKKSPYLVTGWLWFLGTLVPVIGIIQGGLWPQLADRWAYVPFIGLYIIVAWGVPDISLRLRSRIILPAILAPGIIMALIILTSVQLGNWKNSYTLFQHALDVTSGNYIAHNQVGSYFAKKGNHKAAMQHYLKAFEINPSYIITLKNLGNESVRMNNYSQALKYYNDALLRSPFDAGLFNKIGNTLIRMKKTDKAIGYYLQAIDIDPNDPKFYNNLGAAYYIKGETGPAIKEFTKAIEILPDYAEAYYNIGLALEKTGKTDQAVKNYLTALRIDPDYKEAHNSLANIMFKTGNMTKAIQHYKEVLRITPEDAKAHFNIGVAYYNNNQIRQAAGHFQEALRIDPNYLKARNALIQAKRTLAE